MDTCSNIVSSSCTSCCGSGGSKSSMNGSHWRNNNRRSSTSTYSLPISVSHETQLRHQPSMCLHVAASSSSPSSLKTSSCSWLKKKRRRGFPPHQIMISSIIIILLLHLPTGLLLNSLQEFSEHACEGEILKAICPPDTTIEVVGALFGRTLPSDARCSSTIHGLFPSPHAINSEGALMDGPVTQDTNCRTPNELKKVVNMCQGKRSCRMLADISTFNGVDPCPGTSKYLEVRYKCRPNNYHTKDACENEQVKLRCKQGEALAIYSAMYGRGETGSKACNIPPATTTEDRCESSFALSRLIKKCHGLKRCRFKVRNKVLGEACSEQQEKYLQLVYTCEDKSLLERGTGGGSSMDILKTEYAKERTTHEGSSHINVANGGSPNSPLPHPTRSHTTSTDGEDTNMGSIMMDSMTIFEYMEERKEVFILIFVLTAGAGLIFFISFAIVQVVLKRRREENENKDGVGGGGYQMVPNKPTYQRERAPDDTVLSTEFTELQHMDGGGGTATRFNGRTFRGSESPPPRNYNRYYS